MKVKDLQLASCDDNFVMRVCGTALRRRTNVVSMSLNALHLQSMIHLCIDVDCLAAYRNITVYSGAALAERGLSTNAVHRETNYLSTDQSSQVESIPQSLQIDICVGQSVKTVETAD